MKRLGTGILAITTGLLAPPASSAEVYSSIVLDQNDPAAACELKYKDPKLTAVSGDKIHWEIQNHCGAAQTITLKTFKKTSGQDPDGDPDNPLKEKGSHSKTVRPRGRDVIRGNVKDHSHKPGPFEYTYEVWLGNQKVDPVILIER